MKESQASPDFEALLTYLKHNYGCDLTGYKRPTLLRRFAYRMRSLKIDSYQSYWQYLQDHREEYLALLNEVLINVTSFFRDSDTWDYLATDIIPQIIASKHAEEPIRVWCAGCATGQETYSLLILFAEALGIESCLKRVRCYATDADELAIQKARKANYTDLEIKSIPPSLLDKYFEQTNREYVFHPRLRQTIVFGGHDLAQDAPLSQIDLLTCRNVLMYFNLEAQNTILARFHFALKDKGFLFLGKAETLVLQEQTFSPVNFQHRVFAKGRDLTLEERLAAKPLLPRKATIAPSINYSQFWQTAFAANPIAQVAVDRHGRMIGANEAANHLFELTLNDWGKPFQELPPGKLVSSLISVESFEYDRQPIILKDIEWITSTGTSLFNIKVIPVIDRGNLLGMIFAFVLLKDRS